MKAKKIIIIMTDTQRADMLGCYGNPDMKTPNLDRLAAGGIRFDKAYTVQPVCGPARSALFTGTYPHTNGLWSNCQPLGQQTRTLGQRMKDKGYHTAYIGKWHLDGGDYFGYGICPDGWDPDYWYDMRCYLEELSDEDRLRSRNYATSRDRDFTEEFTYGHRCSNRAIGFLQNHHDEDFLLVLSYDEPHGPALCPPEYEDLYRDYQFPKVPNVYDKLDGKPEYQRVWAGDGLKRDPEKLVISPKELLACNSFVDHEIGRVLDVIDSLAPDALVIYTSDHGDALHNHSICGKGPAMYEEIIRVPMLVRWPGVSPAGVSCCHPVSHIDLVPTVIDASGHEIPKPLEGISMLNTFKSPGFKPRDAVFIEYGRYETDHDGFGGFQPIRCIFDGRYKLVIHLLDSDEFYDLEQDPFELNNLIDSPDHCQVRNRLHDQLLNWMNDTRDPFRGYYWERRPWRSDAGPATWEYTSMTRQKETDEGEKRQLDYETGLEMIDAVRKKN